MVESWTLLVGKYLVLRGTTSPLAHITAFGHWTIQTLSMPPFLSPLASWKTLMIAIPMFWLKEVCKHVYCFFIISSNLHTLSSDLSILIVVAVLKNSNESENYWYLVLIFSFLYLYLQSWVLPVRSYLLILKKFWNSEWWNLAICRRYN